MRSVAEFGAILCNLAGIGFMGAAWRAGERGGHEAAALKSMPPVLTVARFVQACEVGGWWRRSLNLLWVSVGLLVMANTLRIMAGWKA